MFRADFQPPLLIIPIAGLEKCWRCVSKAFLPPPPKITKRPVPCVHSLCSRKKAFADTAKQFTKKNNLNILSRRKILSLCYLRTSDNENKFKKRKNVTKKEKQCGNLRRCFNRTEFSCREQSSYQNHTNQAPDTTEQNSEHRIQTHKIIIEQKRTLKIYPTLTRFKTVAVQA
jgi:hypothetical protein